MNIQTAKILKSLGYENVFVTDPPETLDNYILISSSGGFGVGVEDAGFARPTIQIIVANKSYITMKDTIRGLQRDLLSLSSKDIFEIDATDYNVDWDNTETWDLFEQWYVQTLEPLGFGLSSDTLELGKDEQMRFLNSANFIVYNNII